MSESTVYKDVNGKTSSKRVTGILLLVFTVIVTTLDGFKFFDVDSAIIISMLSFSAAMLGLDSITDIWKQNSNSTTNTEYGLTNEEYDPIQTN
jgi:hypothetical protein